MSTKAPLISIVVPVYNAQDTIGACVESILAQDYEHFELILVNDGSTDDSFKILHKLADKDSRAIAMSQENKGVSEARNLGINTAKGTYLTFIDSDDTVESDYLSSLIEVSDNGRKKTIISGYNFVSPSGKVQQIKPTVSDSNSLDDFVDNFKPLMRSRIFLAPWAKMYSLELVNKKSIRFTTDTSNGEDLVFNMDYFKCETRYAVADYAGYNYIQYASGVSLSSRVDTSKLKSAERVYAAAEDFCHNLGIANRCMSEFARYYFKFCMFTIDQLRIGGHIGLKDDIRKFYKSTTTHHASRRLPIADIESLIYRIAAICSCVFLTNLISYLRVGVKELVR